MKGLILKDLYMSVKNFKVYVLVLVMIYAISFYDQGNLFFAIYPCLISAMIPANLLSYDERSHWDIYCGTLPVTRDMVVSAKYLIGLIFQGILFLVSALVQAIRIGMNEGFTWESYLVLMSLLWITSLVSSSISLPFMFKLGVEKGRMAYYAMVIAASGSGVLTSFAFTEDMHATIPFGAVLILGCVLAAAIYAGSWYLSILFYRKRELH